MTLANGFLVFPFFTWVFSALYEDSVGSRQEEPDKTKLINSNRGGERVSLTVKKGLTRFCLMIDMAGFIFVLENIYKI